ncbi:glutamine synthetase [Jannaschia seohaensis]|uniref:Glutamine synthetase n=2 Tax=Jannaschia seohaensis TaxID=475081 RepID=A0A2Y9B5V5_9RHOB|nr:glutamine synthetase [Jannaschia seohaensis]SSA51821.1 glutamine synthetase [Jannaschia seohaensis]
MGADMTLACTSDFSGLVRGKGFRTADLGKRIESGVGWTPTNVQITCFDTISDSPYGALGDLVLKPDPGCHVDADLPGDAGLSFLLGDIRTLDGAAWECCTRSILKRALDGFEKTSGLEIRASFEHEFMLPGGRETRGFTLAGFAARQDFASALLRALDGADIQPDGFFREYGPDQMEITLPPKPALRAADEAVILRELTRAAASAMGDRATFTPLVSPDVVGNGVHIHLSLWRPDGSPAMWSPEGQDGLSDPASAFVAGMLRHMPAAVALTAPSVLSYRRLVPHRWSAAFNNLGRQDREAGVRICPLTARDAATRARQFNVEYRAADAAASPHLALAALVVAGTLGLRDGLSSPPATTEDLSVLSADALTKRGIVRLPTDLEAALDAFARDEAFRSGFPERMPDIYIAHKRGEIAHVSGMSEEECFAAYASTY